MQRENSGIAYPTNHGGGRAISRKTFCTFEAGQLVEMGFALRGRTPGEGVPKCLKNQAVPFLEMALDPPGRTEAGPG